MFSKLTKCQQIWVYFGLELSGQATKHLKNTGVRGPDDVHRQRPAFRAQLGFDIGITVRWEETDSR